MGYILCVAICRVRFHITKPTQSSKESARNTQPFIRGGESSVNLVAKGRSSYPAARAESLLESQGTRAWMVVPPFGCESIDSVPFTSFSRSSMLISPSPRLVLSHLVVKAYTGILHCEMNLIRRSPQSHFEVPYSTVFRRIVTASCRTRNSEREMSADIGLGKSWLWKSISTFCCLPNSWQKLLTAPAIPKYCTAPLGGAGDRISGGQRGGAGVSGRAQPAGRGRRSGDRPDHRRHAGHDPGCCP